MTAIVWRCEECRAPWRTVDGTYGPCCHRCGNRTREPDPNADPIAQVSPLSAVIQTLMRAERQGAISVLTNDPGVVAAAILNAVEQAQQNGSKRDER